MNLYPIGKLIIAPIFLVFILASCNDDRLLEKNYDISQKGWEYKDSLYFDVQIPDSLTKYNVILNIRHRDVFEWQNMYVKLINQNPLGQINSKEINIPLCDDAGTWYGKCTGDICFTKVFLSEGKRFPRSGKYTYAVVQDMRTNPLKNIISFGMRIEKFNAQKSTSKNEP